MDQIWELDGLKLEVSFDGVGSDPNNPLPAAFGWAHASAEHVNGSLPVDADTVTFANLEVTATWGPNKLVAGDWRIQVRAGETQGTALTVYDEVLTVKRSIQAIP